MCALLVSACAGGPFGRGESDRGAAPLSPPSVTAGTADPSSPAYFQSTVGDRVLFAVDQSTLTASAQQTLSAQAAWLSSNPSYSAIIEGHADEQGTREYNLALGFRRANAVQEYLISQGVAGSRLRTNSFGKERPIEICSSEAGYAQNRRAVPVPRAGPGAGL